MLETERIKSQLQELYDRWVNIYEDASNPNFKSFAQGYLEGIRMCLFKIDTSIEKDDEQNCN